MSGDFDFSRNLSASKPYEFIDKAKEFLKKRVNYKVEAMSDKVEKEFE